MKYKKIDDNNYKIEVIDQIAAGMCDKTIGLTLVIYKRKDDDFHRIMEHTEFYRKYEEV